MAGAGSPTGVPRSGSPPPQGQGCRQSSPFPRREALGESDWAFSWPGQTSVDAACQPKWQTASHHDYPLLTVAMWPTVHRAAVSKNADSVSNRCSIIFLGGDLARPGAGPADRGAAGALRGAARRRPGHHLCGGSQRPALPLRRRHQDLEPDAAGTPAPTRGLPPAARRIPRPSTNPAIAPTRLAPACLE